MFSLKGGHLDGATVALKQLSNPPDKIRFGITAKMAWIPVNDGDKKKSPTVGVYVWKIVDAQEQPEMTVEYVREGSSKTYRYTQRYA